MDIFFILLISLFVTELLYFKVADKLNIVDKPNHRSSHSSVTIRGGGIVFTVAMFACAIYLNWEYGYFMVGLLIISFISFADDIKPVSNKVRILFHLIAVMFLLYQLQAYRLPYYIIFIAFVLVTGVINAINFMDGINGITGGYALVTLFTLCYLNESVIIFTDKTYLVAAVISLLVFNFFNFRRNARCFAGDVGSVSIAFIISFFMLQLILRTHNFNYLLLLLLYGLDTVTTIFFRICRRENIFEAHRTHFYQFLANEKGWPHLWVATLYGLVQLCINFFLIYFFHLSLFNVIAVVVIIALSFLLTRYYFEGPQKLFKHHSNN